MASASAAALSLFLTYAFAAIPSCNTPDNRQCWGDYDIHTNYYIDGPDTGVVREYDLVLTNGRISPDGVDSPVMLINNQYPGPKIEGDWGDTMRVAVHNKLSNLNGTAMHWHGMRQLNTNWQDGVPGVTQCPISPRESQRYEFRLSQYGTSWYHSHFGLQAAAGVFGPLKINGPTSMNYDEDVGPMVLSYWYHVDPNSLFEADLINSFEDPDSILLNGQGVYCAEGSAKCSGSYHEINFVAGKTYKMGLINAGVRNQHVFWLEGHTFSVVATDLVPIQPYETDTLYIGVGQRYDIIVAANADLSHCTDFWIHAHDCFRGFLGMELPSNLGIIRYTPTSTAMPQATFGNREGTLCMDPPQSSLAPIVQNSVSTPANGLNPSKFFNISQQFFPSPDIPSPYRKWSIFSDPFQINWTSPSLQIIANNHDMTGAFFPDSYSPINFANVTDHEIFQFPISHPIHLHGHDFSVLSQGLGEFDPANFDPVLENPPRRDTATVPGGGHMVIAFQMDNPGAWLMHCHLPFHSSAGMAMQFVESAGKLLEMVDAASIGPGMDRQCEVWARDYGTANMREGAMQGEESGI